MTTKNLYFRSVLQRQNIVKMALLNVFLSLSSYPRLLLEVFIRKNFGERYFSLASVISVAVVLLVLPGIAHSLSPYLSFSEGYKSKAPNFWLTYGTWYAFLPAFMYFSFKRWQEIKTNPSVFDFARFSLYAGDIHPFFFDLQLSGKKLTVRQIEILIEPAAFLVAGLVLSLLGQALGTLLIVTSIFYGLSYAGAYKAGDDFMMNKIDEIIMNEEMQNAFVLDKDASEARGVRFYARKPGSTEQREKLVHSILDDEAADVK